MSSQPRSPERLRAHYEIEKELASKLRNGTKEERQTLYSSLYNELFQKVPDHPQLTRKVSEKESSAETSRQLSLLRPFLKPTSSTFLEIGPGDCALSFELCKIVKKVYGADVSEEITSSTVAPHNFELVIFDGCDIPIEPETVDIAYSHQLMEHIHPEDAIEQLNSIYKVLKRGGAYVCITPSRLNGPHDISKYFDKVAMGFHLKEYTNRDLSRLFRQAGFTRFKALIAAGGRCIAVPIGLCTAGELLLGLLPQRLRRVVGNLPPVRVILGVRLVAFK